MKIVNLIEQKGFSFYANLRELQYREKIQPKEVDDLKRDKFIYGAEKAGKFLIFHNLKKKKLLPYGRVLEIGMGSCFSLYVFKIRKSF